VVADEGMGAGREQFLDPDLAYVTKLIKMSA
jgi:hypothetical protein